MAMFEQEQKSPTKTIDVVNNPGKSYSLEHIPSHWGYLRRQLHHGLREAEGFIGLVVVINFVFIIWEVDIAVSGELIPPWLVVLKTCFVVFYTCELAIRIFVQRTLFWHYGVNAFDFIIVLIGIAGEFMQSQTKAMEHVTVLRCVRLLRVLRVLRMVSIFHELWILIRDALASLRTLVWAFVLCLLCLSIWSVFAVELLHSLAEELHDCDWCQTAFASVMQANLTFFGLVTFGAGWGDLARPLMEKHPWTAIIFMGVIFTMMMGVMNILVAAMCENAAQGRQDDLNLIAAAKEKGRASEEEELVCLCQKLDCDGDGAISLSELQHAVESVPEFKARLQAMDIQIDELNCVFHILDSDKSGEVTYTEFAHQLWKMRNQELGTMLSITKYYVLRLWDESQCGGHRSDDFTNELAKLEFKLEEKHQKTLHKIHEIYQLLKPTTHDLPATEVIDLGAHQCHNDLMHSSQCQTKTGTSGRAEGMKSQNQSQSEGSESPLHEKSSKDRSPKKQEALTDVKVECSDARLDYVLAKAMAGGKIDHEARSVDILRSHGSTRTSRSQHSARSRPESTQQAGDTWLSKTSEEHCDHPLQCCSVHPARSSDCSEEARESPLEKNLITLKY